MSHQLRKYTLILQLLFLVLLLISCAIINEPRTAAPSSGSSTTTATADLTPPTSIPQPEANPTVSSITLIAPTEQTPVKSHYPDLSEQDLPLSPVSYILPLTIRHLAEDRASLFFELNVPAGGFLFYQELSPEPGETKTFPINPAETRQMITLEGLSSGKEYVALVGLGNEAAGFQQPSFLNAPWGSVRFRTPDGQEPLKVAVFSDTSFGDSATEALVALMTSYDIDFVIDAGDIVDKIEENNNPVEAFALKYFKTLSPLLHRLPIYTVMGNHDYDANVRWLDSYFYYYAFPAFPDPRFNDPGGSRARQYYAFAYNDIQFLMLDSQVFFGVPGWEEQDSWLAERLSDPRFRFSIPIFHVPPFFSGSVHPDDQLPVRQFWHPLLVSANVPLALSGHSHHYERLQADGITYVVSGGGSNTLYSVGTILPQSQVFASRTHFVLLNIYSDRIELSAVDKQGEQFDQTVIPLQ